LRIPVGDDGLFVRIWKNSRPGYSTV